MKYFLLLFTLLNLYQCSQKDERQTYIAEKQSVAILSGDSILCPENLLEHQSDTIPPTLFAPKIRYDICGWWMPEDTITPNGNFINYLISNDTCCRDYLYLAWGNNYFKNLENLGLLRQYHPKMSPGYIGESEDYLFFGSPDVSGLPSTGWDIWLFPLSAGSHSAVFTTISPDAFDLKSLTIVREVEENRTDFNVIEAYNIRTKRVKKIQLKSSLNSASPTWSLDSISITPQTIFVRIWTRDSVETIFLPNDLK